MSDLEGLVALGRAPRRAVRHLHGRGLEEAALHHGGQAAQQVARLQEGPGGGDDQVAVQANLTHTHIYRPGHTHTHTHTHTQRYDNMQQHQQEVRSLAEHIINGTSDCARDRRGRHQMARGRHKQGIKYLILPQAGHGLQLLAGQGDLLRDVLHELIDSALIGCTHNTRPALLHNSIATSHHITSHQHAFLHGCSLSK